MDANFLQNKPNGRTLKRWKKKETSKGETTEQKSVGVLNGGRKGGIVYFLSSPGVLWRINYQDDVSIAQLRAL